MVKHFDTWYINYSMQQSPSWEAEIFSTSQEIPIIRWSLTFIILFTRAGHFPCPYHGLLSYYFRIHSDIVLSSMLRYPKLLLFSRFSHQKTLWFLSPPPPSSQKPHAPPRSFSFIWSPENIWWELLIMSLIILQFSPVSCYFHFFTSKYLCQRLVF